MYDAAQRLATVLDIPKPGVGSAEFSLQPRSFDDRVSELNTALSGFLDSDFSEDEGPSEPPCSAVRATSVWDRLFMPL